MSQSTTPSEDRAVLCQRGEELSEFSALFSELAMPVQECNEGIPDLADFEGARLAVVSGRTLLDSGNPNLNGWPRTLVVVDDGSRTLVKHLSRLGAAMVIRRPIHPHALRLLLLHEIYRGPERRTKRRVLIGHTVKIGTGLFKPRALLLELSPTGARLEVANPPKVGSELRIQLGNDLTKGKTVRLRTKVIRCTRRPGEKRGGCEIAVSLLDPTAHAREIRSILDRFAFGPARWPAGAPAAARPTGGTATRSTDCALPTPPPVAAPPDPSAEAPPATRRAEDLERPDRAFPDAAPFDVAGDLVAAEGSMLADDLMTAERSTPEDETIVFAETTPEDETIVFAETTLEADPSRPIDPVPATGFDPDMLVDAERFEFHEDVPERRGEVRVAYDERVVALVEEAARIVVGRDLSSGGMRIEATSRVRVGDTLRVALHSGVNADPIVVVAHAVRDDGEDGIALAFDTLSQDQQACLTEIIDAGLPIHSTDLDGSESDADDAGTLGESIVFAEMLGSIDPAGGHSASMARESGPEAGEVVERPR